MTPQTLLVGLAHPDDEVGVAGTILAQRARGDRVVIVWLTQGEMTEAFGDLPREQVAARRREQGARAAELLGAEHHFLDFNDTRLAATPDAAERVARLLAEIRPDGLITWGDAWVRGMRHPDHQACGRIFRDAVTLARIRKVVAPAEPHRAAVPVWTLRDVLSPLPAAVVDVAPYMEQIRELARFYHQGIGFGDAEWLERHLARQAEPYGLARAEVLDAWETAPGQVASLLPTALIGLQHPDPQTTRSR